MWKWLIGALAAASMFFWWSNADAQQTQGTKCAPIDKIITMLREGHDEIPIANMRDTRGNLMQLWGNIDTGTWTLFYIPNRPSEMATAEACYLDEGTNLAIGGRPRS